MADIDPDSYVVEKAKDYDDTGDWHVYVGSGGRAVRIFKSRGEAWGGLVTGWYIRIEGNTGAAYVGDTKREAIINAVRYFRTHMQKGK